MSATITPREIDRAVLEEVLRLLRSDLPDRLKISRIAAAVASGNVNAPADVQAELDAKAMEYGVTRAEMMDPSTRHERVVAARWAAWHALFTTRRLSYAAIGAACGFGTTSVRSGVLEFERTMKRPGPPRRSLPCPLSSPSSPDRPSP